MDWIENASRCPVLQGIDNERLLEVFGQLHFQVKKYKKDEIIAHQGDVVKGLQILLVGSVRGEMIDFSGRMLKIEDIEAPKPLAGAFLFGKNNRYPVDIVANLDVSLLTIFKEEFLKLLQLCPAVQLNYLNLVSSKAQFLSNKIKFLSFKSIRGKISHYLLQQKGHEEGFIVLKESQQALAELFGVARPSVARAFKQLEEEGILELKNRQIKVLDRQKLLENLQE